MLAEYKEIYKKKAMNYPGWDTLDRSQLCFNYVELEKENKPTSQDCLSAIIFRFWNLPMNSFYSQEKLIATEDDCYNWLIESVMFCLNSRPWEDSKSSLFNDLNGPEKAINVCFSNSKINFFVGAKRQKRVVNYDSLSLDTLQEDASDAYYMPVYDDDPVSNSFFADVIKEYYSKKDYLPSFILDSVIDFDFFDRFKDNDITSYQFSRRKLKHHLRNIDPKYCEAFSKKYNIDYEDVIKASKYITDLSYDRMTRGVNNFFKSLERNKDFMEALKC